MKPSEFLFEAEQNIKKAKANQYLDQLSDADLVAVASLLKGSLEESAQDLSAQKKAGKRIDGRPSDFIAYDDTTQTAKRYQETPQGLRVLDVNYSPPPRGYVSPGQSAPVITPQPEVKQYVASLDNKEKEALLNVVKKEAKKRKSEPKKSEPKKSSSGKIVAGVLAGLLALGIYNSGSSTDSSKSDTDTKIEKPVEDYSIPEKHVQIKDYNWYKVGFNNIMEADFIINNSNPYPIKDIEIKCTHFSPSGTAIDSNTRTIYEIIPANKSKKFKGFSMGFIHSQAVSTNCTIESVQKS
jgi:hypothetical protein